jgi:uncharacterized protein YuzE
MPLYFRLDETPIVESEEIQPGVIVDFDADGRIVGIEMLNLSLCTDEYRDYTKEREELFGDKTLDEIVKEIKQARDESSEQTG